MRWFAAGLGVALVVLGAVITLRPTTSLRLIVVLVGVALIATGIAEVAEASRWTSPLARRALGAILVVAGVAALAWPGLTTAGLALIVGVGLVVHGLVEIVAGFRGDTEERTASVLKGAASVIIGVIALVWPSVTLLVVAVLFGIRTVIFGGSLLFGAIFDRHHDPAVDPDDAAVSRPSRARRFVHVVGALIALALALVLAVIAIQLHAGEPVVDEFYDTPDDVAAEPGQLLRSEVFDREVPDGSKGWRILYTTTRTDGSPAVASAIVVVPDEPSGAAAPVIAWSHGTTGIARTCAPSVAQQPFESGALFVADKVVEQGWAIVTTDYVGLGTEGPHPYLIGKAEAHSELDAVRAAHQLEGVDLAPETVLWGHSQGGHATLWAAQLASEYAPELQIVGAAALSPASDLMGLMDNLKTMTGGAAFAAFVATAYSEVYPDVSLDDLVRPESRVIVQDFSRHCLAEPAALVSIVSSLTTGFDVFRDDIGTGAFGERIRENIPEPQVDFPLFVGQGLTDPLVLPEVQKAFVDKLCANGQPVQLNTYEGKGHVEVVAADSPLIPDLIAWTNDRFDGAPATPNCHN